MSAIAQTPLPTYYAVIFTSIKQENAEGYDQMAEWMNTLAQSQPGFLGIESARNAIGITVSYWSSIEAIRSWKQHADHLQAQQLGKTQWYSDYKVRICKVERDYNNL